MGAPQARRFDLIKSVLIDLGKFAHKKARSRLESCRASPRKAIVWASCPSLPCRRACWDSTYRIRGFPKSFGNFAFSLPVEGSEPWTLIMPVYNPNDSIALKHPSDSGPTQAAVTAELCFMVFQIFLCRPLSLTRLTFFERVATVLSSLGVFSRAPRSVLAGKP